MEKKVSAKLTRSLDETQTALLAAERISTEAQLKCNVLLRDNGKLRQELQRFRTTLPTTKTDRDGVRSPPNDAIRLQSEPTSSIRSSKETLASIEGINVITCAKDVPDASTVGSVFTGSDLNNMIQLVTALNTQLQQLADAVVLSFHREQQNGTAHAPGQLGMDALDSIERLLGYERVGLLRRRKDSHTLRLCFLTELTTLVHGYIAAGPLPPSSPLEDSLQAVHEQISICGEFSLNHAQSS